MDSKEASKLAYIQKEIELRQNLVGGGFLTAPVKEDELRANIIGQISYAQGFDTDNALYIMQYMFLSKGWAFEDDIQYQQLEVGTVDQTEINRRQTVTQLCRPQGVTKNGIENYRCNFCFPFDYQLLCSSFESNIYLR